jgi:conjugative transfer pilus assembly protein TraH
VACLVAALAAASAPVSLHAGFLEDFYTSAGGTMNITLAQALAGSTMNGFTGGSLVMRTPSKSLTPISFTPPSFNAGCGGINIFTGSFGFASKQEFINFMRKVVQNASGLAFKAALTAMSPMISKEMEDIRNKIQEWNKMFADSCKAAEYLTDNVGPWTNSAVEFASKWAAENGLNNYTEAKDANAQDGSAAIDGMPSVKNADGGEEMKFPLNIVWKAMNSNRLSDLLPDDKVLLMSAIGTVVVKKNGDKLEPEYFDGKVKASDLVGTVDSETSEIEVHSCDGDTVDCTSINRSGKITVPSVAYKTHKAIGTLSNAIASRSSLGVEEENAVRELVGKSSLPILKIIGVLSSPRYQYILDINRKNYAEVIAYDIALAQLNWAMEMVEKILSSGEMREINKEAAEHLAKIREDVHKKRSYIYQQQNNLYATMQNQAATVDMVARMEKSLYASVGSQMAANLRFKPR